MCRGAVCQPAPFPGVVPPACLHLSPESTPPTSLSVLTLPPPPQSVPGTAVWDSVYSPCAEPGPSDKGSFHCWRGKDSRDQGHSYSYLRNLLTH